MQLLKKDFKGVTRLKAQSLDDLWALKHILKAGDVIGARTLRTIQIEKREKKPTFLKIKLERIEFDERGNLRLGGEIVAAKEEFLRGWHTFSVRPADVLSIEKPAGWLEHQKRRLQEALAYKGLKVLICVLDDRQADFALATELRIKYLTTIHNRAAGKRYAKGKAANAGQFFKDIIAVLEENLSRVDKIIIAGPGFTKDDLMKKLPGEIKKKSVPGAASVTGLTGLNEVIKRGALDRLVAGTRLSKETALVEKFLTAVAKELPATYGKKEVGTAAEAGAVDTLLVSDRLVHEKDIEELMKNVEKMRGTVYIINSTHEAGEKLLGMGGLGALLRYKI